MKKRIFALIFIIFILTILSCGYAYSRFFNNSLFGARHIFIDGGAYKGGSIAAFEKTDLYSKYRWEIFAFEANPELIRFIPRKPNVTVFNKALWTDDKGVDFYFGINDLGGNVVKALGSDERRAPVHVESVDFGKWLKKNFKKKDVIYVQMDIEASEYPILEQMLKDGSIAYIDKLYVEFHSWMKVGMEEVYKSKDKDIIQRIRKLGIPLCQIDAQHCNYE